MAGGLEQGGRGLGRVSKGLGAAGIAQAQSPQLLYDLIDGVDLLLVIGR